MKTRFPEYPVVQNREVTSETFGVWKTILTVLCTTGGRGFVAPKKGKEAIVVEAHPSCGGLFQVIWTERKSTYNERLFLIRTYK